MNLIVEILILILAYLIGAIPFGYILTKKLTGKNILEFGSGNVGSTNVKRVAGKKIALYTQLLDMLKGLLPISILLYLKNYQNIDINEYYIYAVAIISILGHNFSVFLKFRGGKGVNTTLGVSLLIAPYSILISVVLYYIMKWKFRYISLASLTMALSWTITDLIINPISSRIYYLLAITALIFITHGKNIQRLLNGTENK